VTRDELTVAGEELVSEVTAQARERWEIAHDEVQLALRQTLAVAFLGSASSGKDSAIRALFGLDFGQVDPIPGSTDRIRVAAVDAEQRLMVINAPGFGDLRAAVEAEARRALDQLDLAVYVVNCDGGATIDERRDLDAIRDLGRPTLVCLNKIDLIREHQRDAFVTSTLAQLGVEPDDCVVTAFDPLPALSEEPIGVEAVIGWIHRHLEKQGKSLLFAKHLRNRAAACTAIIRAAARRSAVAGAIPVPGADATAVTAIQVKLISDIAAVFSRRMDKELVLFILGEALAGGSKSFVRWALNAAKTAGWVPGTQAVHVATSALGSAIAAATTYGVGQASVAWMQKEGNLSGLEIREIFDAEAHAYRREVAPNEPPRMLDAADNS
jgi:GTP-binding protein EngB required for normal cell division/uncharacterized protein (DUF697 family)